MTRVTRETLPATVDCGHAPQPTFYTAGSRVQVGDQLVTLTGEEVMFPGYAVMPDGRKLCPDCADDVQRADMRTAQRFTAYLSSNYAHVTTWTGGYLGSVERYNNNDRQTFVRVLDVHGNWWTGIGPSERGTYVSLRRIKGE